MATHYIFMATATGAGCELESEIGPEGCRWTNRQSPALGPLCNRPFGFSISKLSYLPLVAGSQ